MNKSIIYSSLLLVSLGLSSCENFFDMRPTQDRTMDYFDNVPSTWLSGLVDFGYVKMPINFYSIDNQYLDTSTDNAVTRSMTTSMERMATQGSAYVTKDNYPLDNWQNFYQAIRVINTYFVEWSKIEDDDTIDEAGRKEAFTQRSMGECYFTRAWNHFELLRRHAGIDASGQLMGIPLMLEVMEVSDISYLPRETFAKCIEVIVQDLDDAIERLPKAYDGTAQNGLTASVCNTSNIGRATSVAAKALKSRVLLYAASPLYNTQDDIESYRVAAVAAQDLINEIGTKLPDVYNVSQLGSVTSNSMVGDPLSQDFYSNDISEEIILPKISSNENTNSSRNFPPGISFDGDAATNPSQNLVDAFPMQNGYPINHEGSGYSDSRDNGEQYELRDARFYMTVLYNGQHFQGNAEKNIVQIYPGGRDYIGATNVDTESTRTGYFLRKWTNSGVVVVGNKTSKAYHPIPLLRKVEAFLNFAEAVLEVDGIDGTTYGMSARQAIGEVRARAGIATNRAGIPATIDNDEFLASITSIDEMRELIRNERRIELCFENHRFYDLRRWKEDLNTPVKGIFFADANDKVGEIRTITTDGGVERIGAYDESYMYFGPIPNSEVLTTNGSLTQNVGW